MKENDKIDSLDVKPKKQKDNTNIIKLVMGLLCYLLPFIPFFFIKDDDFIQFHSTQGMELLIVAVGLNILMAIVGILLPWQLDMAQNIIWYIGETIIALLVLCGLINILTKKTRTLPIIGNLKIID